MPLRNTGIRPLSAEEIARLPAALCEQSAAAPARCGEKWLALSAESPDAPAPQTHRVQVSLAQLGYEAIVISSTRLEVQGYLEQYRNQVRDGAPATKDNKPASYIAHHSLETSASRLAQDLVEYAVGTEASDIHLEYRKTQRVRVRFRRHGRLQDGPFPLRDAQAEAVAHYLFSLGRRGNRPWQANISCDGVVDLQVADAPVQLRLASIPEVRGWDLVARLLGVDKKPLTLVNAGYDRQQTAQIRELCRRAHGAVLFSGPTGSGKSTSMLAALAELPKWIKIISLEQPVERPMPGISHITIGHAGNMRQIAPALNRCDADIAVLGELRDADSASTLADFTTSGKLTLGTVHATRACSIPLRLLEMKINRSLLCDPTFLAGLINQRLLPRLCPHCRLPYVEHKERLPEWWRHRYGPHLHASSEQHIANRADRVGVFLRGDGCEQCSAGIIGRLLIAEVICLDESDCHFLASWNLDGWRKSLWDKGFISLEQTGLNAVLSGEVDPSDAFNAVGVTSEATEAFRTRTAA